MSHNWADELEPDVFFDEEEAPEVESPEAPDHDPWSGLSEEGVARGGRRVRRRRARPFLAGLPVVGVTGINGAGKTLLAVHDAICDMRNGRPVVSTVAIQHTDENGVEHHAIPLKSLSQLLDLEDCTVLLDEVATIFPSSGAGSDVPAEVRVLMQTARHRRITIRWTAPAWGRAQKMLREVTQAWVHVQPVGKRRPFAGELWPEPLWSAVTIADARSGKVDELPERILKRRILRLRRSLAWGAYDTHAETPIIGQPDSGGICVDCGGSRTRAKCGPERHELLGIPAPYVLGGDR